MIETLSKQWVRNLFIAFMWGYVFFKWLLGRPLGWLSLVLAAYLWRTFYSASPPLKPSELLLWAAEQPTDVKTAIATVMVTVIGFLLAFSVTAQAWRIQKKTELRLAAEDEIYAFFQEAASHILTVNLYAEFLIETHQRVHAEPVPSVEELKHLADRLLRETSSFTPARQRLSRMSVECHGIRSKHELVVSDQRFAMNQLVSMIAALNAASISMWFVAPEIGDDPDRKLKMVELSDPGPWVDAAKATDECRLKIEMGNGAIRGLMLGGLVGTSAQSALNFHKTSQFMVDDRKKCKD